MTKRDSDIPSIDEMIITLDVEDRRARKRFGRYLAELCIDKGVYHNHTTTYSLVFYTEEGWQRAQFLGQQRDFQRVFCATLNERAPLAIEYTFSLEVRKRHTDRDGYGYYHIKPQWRTVTPLEEV